MKFSGLRREKMCVGVNLMGKRGSNPFFPIFNGGYKGQKEIMNEQVQIWHKNIFFGLWRKNLDTLKLFPNSGYRGATESQVFGMPGIAFSVRAGPVFIENTCNLFQECLI
jgi:hypothetical protein